MRKNFREKKSFGKGSNDKRDDNKGDLTKKRFDGPDKKYGVGKGDFKKKPFDKEGGGYKKKNFEEKKFGDKKKSFGERNTVGYNKKNFGSDGGGYKKPFKKFYKKKSNAPSPSYQEKTNDDGSIRLNKYIANAGICSRREADVLIATGVVKVNGKIITEMGFKVQPGDIVNYGGQTLKAEKMQYVLLNKPKDFITTSDDPQGRKNVMELVRSACRERIYPVGRLDRTTTGVLLFTNDGELTKRLTHPRYGIKKIYQVTLDQNLKRVDFEAIAAGIELEDGPIKPDAIDYVGDANNEIGIEIHSGRNRIVRRIFEQFNYKVLKLDRVYFAGLTKKDLGRGEWRHLEEKELNILKIVAGSVTK